MYPQQELQRQMDIERGQQTQQQEEIPLHQIKGRNGQELARIEHYRRIFDQYDRNNSGYLEIKEIKKMIKDHTCNNLPKGAAEKIMKMGDTDNDGKLSFDEFYKIAEQRDALIRQYAVQYCRMVVPRRDPGQALDVIDGAYEVNTFTFFS